MTDEAVVTSADIEALIEAELLVFNSAKLVEAQFELTGEPIITTPGLPEAGPLASKLAGLWPRPSEGCHPLGCAREPRRTVATGHGHWSDTGGRRCTRRAASPRSGRTNEI